MESAGGIMLVIATVLALAFEQTGQDYLAIDRLGILMGSFASALVGFVYLKLILPRSGQP